MIFVHIGLPKTYTTTLQKTIFPKLAEIDSRVVFNQDRVNYLSYKHHLFGLEDGEKDEIGIILKDGKHHLISNENLVNINPRLWERSADLNLELFGSDAYILITARETMSYMTSLYQQIIHSGNIVPPNEFFLSSEDCNMLEKISNNISLTHFDAAAYSLESLHNIYKKRFKNVIFAPVSKIRELSFLKNTFKLTDTELVMLQHEFDNTKIINRSYSNTAMKLSFFRERFLNNFGIKSYGSHDRTPYNIGCAYGNIGPSQNKNMAIYPWQKKLLLKVQRKIFRLFNWKHIMMSLVNEYLPYKKYELPNGLPIHKNTIRSNNEFIKKLELLSTDQ